MREPAYDNAVSPDHLLTVDAEVLPLLLGTARDGKAPGDERPGVAGPAVLDRQAREVDVGSLGHGLVARAPGAPLLRHVEHLLEDPGFVPHAGRALCGVGLLQGTGPRAALAQLA